MSHLQRRYRTTIYVGLVAAAVLTAFACVDVHIKNGWCEVGSDCPSGSCNMMDHACFKVAPPGDMSNHQTPPDMRPKPCSGDSDCGDTAPICDLATKLCRGCNDSDGGPSQECQQTSSGSTQGRCASTGACVACTQNVDCAASQRTCVNNSCVSCTDNSQCTTGVCDVSSGNCGGTDAYFFVNQAGPSCATTGGTGAFNDPFCKIQSGLNAMATDKSSPLKQGVIVYSGTYAENISIPAASTSYTVRAIGVGQPVISTTAGLALTGTNFNVSLDGFTITGATGASNAVSCTGSVLSSAALTLTRSTITGNKRYGIASTSCQLTIDQSIITSNDSGGIVATDSTVTVRNSIVANNGAASATAPTGGIKTQTSGGTLSLTVVDSTIYDNITKEIASAGVNCPVGSTSAVFDSVIVGNVISGSAVVLPEISDACNPDTCAFPLVSGGAAGTNTVNLSGCTPAKLFSDVTATDPAVGFVPVASATCTLVDKGAMTNAGKTLTAPTVDLTGKTTRPQGAGYDIGALEYKK